MSTLEVEKRSRIGGPVEKIVRRILRALAIGANVVHGVGLRVGRGVVISAPHKLTLGNWVSIGPRSIVQVDGSIGDFAMIGMHVQIVGRDDHAIDEVGRPLLMSTWIGDRPEHPRDAIVIERDVWVGGGSVLLSGITVGEGSIVGAGSVVTKDVLPFSIVAGNPARFIRSRFTNASDVNAHRAGLDLLSRQLAAGDH